MNQTALQPEQPAAPLLQLAPAQVKKYVQDALRRAYPELAKSFFKIQSDGKNNRLLVSWFDGPTEKQIRAICAPYVRFPDGRASSRSAPLAIFEVDGKRYQSHVWWVSYDRYFTAEKMRRYTAIVCRKYQQKQPEVVWNSIGIAQVSHNGTGKNEIETEEYGPRQLAWLIHHLARETAEADLPALEKEAEALYPPPPAYTESELCEQQRVLDEERAHRAQDIERQRQELIFCLRISRRIGHMESQEKLEQEIAAMYTKLARLYPQHSAPVVCAECLLVTERASSRPVNDLFFCMPCIERECVGLTPEDYAPEDGEPVDLASIPQVALPDSYRRRQPEPEPFKPLRNWEGVYLGKDGRPLPILTRDLLHGARMGKWWLRFSYKPSEATRKVLKDAGWRWGPVKEEWYHGDRFGEIPPVVLEIAGAYIDGGFCTWREHRARRLRDYADRVERRADLREREANDLVKHYMSTGTLLVGPRQTRSLAKKKSRAERLAHEAREFDLYARDLRERANASERHQATVTRTPFLQKVIKDLKKQRAKLDDVFLYEVRQAARHHQEPAHRDYRSEEDLLEIYERDAARKGDILDEEIEWLEAVIEERRSSADYIPREVIEVPVPDLPERSFDVDAVVEITVGADNRLDLYPTPSWLGDRLLNDEELYPIPPTARRILEPHGGTGSLIRAIDKYIFEHGTNARIYTCELNPELHQILEAQPLCAVEAFDFLTYHPQNPFDAIVLNPPFSNGVWLAHILHALELLAEGGTLLAILPLSFFSETKAKCAEFRSMVEENGAWVKIEGGAFRESGTFVPVVLVSYQR